MILNRSTASNAALAAGLWVAVTAVIPALQANGAGEMPYDENPQPSDADRKADPVEFIRCIYHLVYLALQTDSTCFATLMLESESSQSSEMWNCATDALGYKGAPHDTAHKRPDDFSGKWDQWRAEQYV